MFDSLIAKIMPYKTIAIIVTVVLLIVAIAAAIMRFYNWAYDNGEIHERQKWTEAQSTANKSLLDRAIKAENALRQSQADNQLALNNISAQYQRELNDAKTKVNDTIAKSRAGSLVLRDKYATTNNAAACSGVAKSSASDPGGRNVQTGAQLSGQTSEFLIGLTNEADDAVRQLTACQATVTQLVDFINKRPTLNCY